MIYTQSKAFDGAAYLSSRRIPDNYSAARNAVLLRSSEKSLWEAARTPSGKFAAVANLHQHLTNLYHRHQSTLKYREVVTNRSAPPAENLVFVIEMPSSDGPAALESGALNGRGRRESSKSRSTFGFCSVLHLFSICAAAIDQEQGFASWLRQPIAVLLATTTQPSSCHRRRKSSSRGSLKVCRAPNAITGTIRQPLE